MELGVAAFLRGINVGGNKKMDMASLRRVLTDLGYAGARTHLQSGNAVFVCTEAEISGAAERIEAAIEAGFGFECRVILRTEAELRRALLRDPLGTVATNPSRHLIGFLADDPAEAGAAELEANSTATDLVRVDGRHVYMWCPDGISVSPLFKLNIDRMLGTAVTMRNWNTVTKVTGMLG